MVEKRDLAKQQPQVTEVSLTVQDIKRYICPQALDPEIMLFLKVCQVENLNPFRKEIWLIKYKEGDPATIVVAADAWIKAADNDPEFDGMEFGVVLDKEGKAEFRTGEFVMPGEKLVGGWAKTYRKDRQFPSYSVVGLKEYEGHTRTGELTRFWKQYPATMICKVAKVHSLKLSFPNRYAGYKSDLDDDVNGIEYKRPEPDTPGKQLARQKFMDEWAGEDEKTPKNQDMEAPLTAQASKDTTASPEQAQVDKGKDKAEKVPATLAELFNKAFHDLQMPSDVVLLHLKKDRNEDIKVEEIPKHWAFLKSFKLKKEIKA